MPFKINSGSNVNHEYVDVIDEDGTVVAHIQKEPGKKAVVQAYPKAEAPKPEVKAETPK